MLCLYYQLFELFPAHECTEIMLYKRHFLNSTASGFMKIPFSEMRIFYLELMGEVDSEIQTGAACQHWERERSLTRGEIQKSPRISAKADAFCSYSPFSKCPQESNWEHLGRLRSMEKHQKLQTHSSWKTSFEFNNIGNKHHLGNQHLKPLLRCFSVSEVCLSSCCNRWCVLCYCSTLQLLQSCDVSQHVRMLK